MAITIRQFSGAAVQPHLPSLAALRIAVFREWPYLYQGTQAYEAEYLATYARSEASVFVLAFDGEAVVGASTGIPLADEAEAFRAPVAAHGFDIARVFYFGESVLLPAYRGHGLGHSFFDQREAFAASLERFRWTAFCAVRRELGDPRRPEGARSLEPFWRRRGYAPVEGMEAELEWQETWHEGPSLHRLQFWMRPLTLRR